ncbi:three-Cys-motif partner protein TcmP [soil metagenome]
MDDVIPEIGPWSVLKNEIIDSYTDVYLQILLSQPWCEATLYVDAFAGAPENTDRSTGQVVPGSATRALSKSPGFSEYYFIDTDEDRIRGLGRLAEDKSNVSLFHDDANEVLRRIVIPRLNEDSSCRGFVWLDPYSLELTWDVVQRLGNTRRADVAINFPIMDILRNPLRRNYSDVTASQAARMTAWWGDNSWIEQFFSLSPKIDLWGDRASVRMPSHKEIAAAYRDRLLRIGGYQYATDPHPITNSKNGPLYYLLLASNNSTAVKVMNDIFKRKKHASKQPGSRQTGMKLWSDI